MQSSRVNGGVVGAVGHDLHGWGVLADDLDADELVAHRFEDGARLCRRCGLRGRHATGGYLAGYQTGYLASGKIPIKKAAG